MSCILYKTFGSNLCKKAFKHYDLILKLQKIWMYLFFSLSCLILFSCHVTSECRQPLLSTSSFSSWFVKWLFITFYVEPSGFALWGLVFIEVILQNWLPPKAKKIDQVTLLFHPWLKWEGMDSCFSQGHLYKVSITD